MSRTEVEKSVKFNDVLHEIHDFNSSYLKALKSSRVGGLGTTLVFFLFLVRDSSHLLCFRLTKGNKRFCVERKSISTVIENSKRVLLERGIFPVLRHV